MHAWSWIASVKIAYPFGISATSLGPVGRGHSGSARDQILQPLERLRHVSLGSRGGHVSEEKAEPLVRDVPGLPHTGPAVDRFKLVPPDAAYETGSAPVGRFRGPCDPPTVLELGDGIDHAVANAVLH